MNNIYNNLYNKDKIVIKFLFIISTTNIISDFI